MDIEHPDIARIERTGYAKGSSFDDSYYYDCDAKEEDDAEE